jgi:hypothetical protein
MYLTCPFFVLLTNYTSLKQNQAKGGCYERLCCERSCGDQQKSWEDAAKLAVETAGKTVKDLRIGEVVKQDVTVENGKVVSYRVRMNISFKYKDK